MELFFILAIIWGVYHLIKPFSKKTYNAWIESRLDDVDYSFDSPSAQYERENEENGKPGYWAGFFNAAIGIFFLFILFNWLSR